MAENLRKEWEILLRVAILSASGVFMHAWTTTFPHPLSLGRHPQKPPLAPGNCVYQEEMCATLKLRHPMLCVPFSYCHNQDRMVGTEELQSGSLPSHRVTSFRKLGCICNRHFEPEKSVLWC